MADEDGGSPPPLPPKPRQKISVMGSPNTEHFIVMDNSALFSARQKREGEDREEKKAEEKKQKLKQKEKEGGENEDEEADEAEDEDGEGEDET